WEIQFLAIGSFFRVAHLMALEGSCLAPLIVRDLLPCRVCPCANVGEPHACPCQELLLLRVCHGAGIELLRAYCSIGTRLPRATCAILVRWL
ncbi:hypothetical protein HAX54_020094, partial [Datura stramonium]|nr:hypothetical protein [Datura stramonium]